MPNFYTMVSADQIAMELAEDTQEFAEFLISLRNHLQDGATARLLGSDVGDVLEDRDIGQIAAMLESIVSGLRWGMK